MEEIEYHLIVSVNGDEVYDSTFLSEESLQESLHKAQRAIDEYIEENIALEEED